MPGVENAARLPLAQFLYHPLPRAAGKVVPDATGASAV